MALPITTNLVFHLDANTLSGNTNGTAISLWSDQSTKNYDAHQTTGTNQPLVYNDFVNGNSVVLFDGVDNFMTAVGLSAELNNTAYEFFIIAKAKEPVALSPFISWNDYSETDTSNYIHARNSDTNNDIEFNMSKDGNTQILAMAGDVNVRWTIYNCRYDGKGGNGGAKGTLTMSVGYVTNSVGCNRSSTSLDHVVLGATDNTAGTANFFNGEIAEIACYNVELSDADRETVRDNLIAKYDITNLGYGRASMAFFDSNTCMLSGTTTGYDAVDDDYSWGCWYKHDGSYTGSKVLMCQGGNYGSDHMISLSFSSDRFRFTLKPGSDVKIGNVHTEGGWYHVVITSKSGVVPSPDRIMKLYVNGVEEASGLRGLQSHTPTTTMVIGNQDADIGLGLRNADGQIAYARTWSKVLTSTEVTELYNGGQPQRHAELSSGLTTNLDNAWELANWDTATTGEELTDQEGTKNLTNVGGNVDFNDTGLEILGDEFMGMFDSCGAANNDPTMFVTLIWNDYDQTKTWMGCTWGNGETKLMYAGVYGKYYNSTIFPNTTGIPYDGDEVWKKTDGAYNKLKFHQNPVAQFQLTVNNPPTTLNDFDYRKQQFVNINIQHSIGEKWGFDWRFGHTYGAGPPAGGYVNNQADLGFPLILDGDLNHAGFKTTPNRIPDKLLYGIIKWESGITIKWQKGGGWGEPWNR